MGSTEMAEGEHFWVRAKDRQVDMAVALDMND